MLFHVHVYPESLDLDLDLSNFSVPQFLHLQKEYLAHRIIGGLNELI